MGHLNPYCPFRTHICLVQKLISFNICIQGTKAFCSGGDQSMRSTDGYADKESFGRLNVLDLQASVTIY